MTTDQASDLRNLLSSSRDTARSSGSVGPKASEAVPSERKGRVSFGPSTRTRPARMRTPRLVRAVAVASGKGGVGKSNLSLNLAIEVARTGRRVAIFDADLGCANVDVLCGLQVRSTLADVVSGRRRLSEIMVKIPGVRGRGGVGLVPGASGVMELASLNATQRTMVIEQLAALEKVVDLVIIDVGAGIAADAIGFARAADSVLLTCTPEPTAMTDAYAAAKLMLSSGEAPDLSLVVNMAGNDEEGLAVHRRMDQVARRHLGRGLALAGVVPFDFSVVAAVKRRRPLAIESPDALATRAIRTIAGSLIADPPAGERSVRRSGFLGGLLRSLARDR